MGATVQGRFRFRQWTNWFGIVGDRGSSHPPLVVIPGGPGAPHHLFEPLAHLAPPDRPLIYYDPSGAGESYRPTGIPWNLDVFVDELAALHAELDLERFHLLGSSFGGTVALAFALRRPRGLLSMTLVGASHSYPMIRDLVHAHLRTLPVAQVLLDPAFPAWGTPFSSRQARALHEYSSLFICRVTLPQSFARAIHATNFEAMNAMKGHGFLYNGNLRDLDLTDRLAEIDVPTLVACGRHDVFFPRVYEDLQQRLPQGRLEVFPMSSHMPHLEEPTDFARIMFAFITEHDQL